VTYRLKYRSVEPEETSIARERLVPALIDTHATRVIVLSGVFYAVRGDVI
jgi:hypothetical protein